MLVEEVSSQAWSLPRTAHEEETMPVTKLPQPTFTEFKLPRLLTVLPGPEASRVLAFDHEYVSPSYTRSYPLVASRGRGAIVKDVDGNTFLDFAAGIAVVAT